MSSEDLQTCDDLVAQMKQQFGDVSTPSSNALPYLVTPAEAEITSPDYGGILPFAPVVIEFKQPPENAGVSYRNFRVMVTSITGGNLERVGDQYAVVPLLPTGLQITWTPSTPGNLY
jgi:hypothetical protein